MERQWLNMREKLYSCLNLKHISWYKYPLMTCEKTCNFHIHCIWLVLCKRKKKFLWATFLMSRSSAQCMNEANLFIWLIYIAALHISLFFEHRSTCQPNFWKEDPLISMKFTISCLLRNGAKVLYLLPKPCIYWMNTQMLQNCVWGVCIYMYRHWRKFILNTLFGHFPKSSETLCSFRTGFTHLIFLKLKDLIEMYIYNIFKRSKEEMRPLLYTFADVG